VIPRLKSSNNLHQLVNFLIEPKNILEKLILKFKDAY